jgi:predicted nuclease with RNAse H fold
VCGDTLSYDADVSRAGLDDRQIYAIIAALAARDQVAIGIDAPLSYNIGGKDRPADSALRAVIIAHGMRSGSVMPPTFQRMAYLTLRGIGLVRALENLNSQDAIRVAEVHPGAALALRGAPVADIIAVKADPRARARLLEWARGAYIRDLPMLDAPSDHTVMSVASALAASDWGRSAAKWLWPAEPPFHPYDVAC